MLSLRRTFLGLVTTGLFIFSSVAISAPITLLSQHATWNYNQTASNLYSGFTARGYGDFVTNYTGTSTGQAAFGNASSGVPVPNTNWTANTDLALQTTTTLTGSVIGDVTINLAIDNGAIVFVNGVKVFAAMAGGFTSIWEYSQTISGSLFNVGVNTISVLAEDHGGATYFDMELVAKNGVNAKVSEPNILLLLGLSGLVLLGRRLIKA